jgi:hypothetical protein
MGKMRKPEKERKKWMTRAVVPFSPANDYLFPTERTRCRKYDTFKGAKKDADNIVKNGLKDREGYYNRTDVEILHNGKIVQRIEGIGGI